MDILENEHNGHKVIMLVFVFLIGLALGFLASAISFQKKLVTLQSQLASLQQKQTECKREPVPPNGTEPPNLPDFAPPSNNGKIPAPLP